MLNSRSALRLAGTLALLFLLAPVATLADILISELCDPRLNYASDRFIEIYNPDDEAVDLTGWQLIAVANGVDAFTWNLSGLIDAHQAMVAGDATTVDVFPVAFPDEAWSGATGNWNGKVGDGARLVDPFGTVTDYVVATGTMFENADYVRNGDISSPNPTYTPAEWISAAVNLASDGSPGTHQTSTPPSGPVIASITTDPLWPEAEDVVHVFADITDAGANIAAVVLAWGTAPTSLPNEIDMTLFSGDTYRTVTPVPVQAGGTTVYYRVEAANDLPATTISPLQGYSLALNVTIQQIQGQAPSSPYAELTATTRGVVTACFGDLFVIQDGSGPWTGLWVRGNPAPAVGDSVIVTGRVTENESAGTIGNTMLADALVVGVFPGASLPDPFPISTADAGTEPFEGVLIEVTNAVCTDADLDGNEWQADDGSGAVRIGVLGYQDPATLGSAYGIKGPVAFGFGRFKIEPRDADDVLWTADHTAPVVSRIVVLGDTALRVVYSEFVDFASASVAGNYVIPGLVVTGAHRESGHPDQVILTLAAMATGDYTLSVSGVTDLFGNVMTGASAPFSYLSPGIPPDYYDDAGGLSGDDLKVVLHDIIRDHVAYSYTYAWTAYYTTDVRPDNGKVWDIYSDIPGGTPPYLYTLGVDEGGVGGQEGTGYTREHTWCKSWFGGEVSPMYTDLFTLFPCDTHMNGTRGIYAYGETSAPQLVSLNGSKVGPSSVPGYVGTVFEPIDDFKGDLARAYLYFSTRYFSEDAGWPGGPATDGAELRPWALDMFIRWIDEDPVSQKEIDRNNAIYLIQGNRNPFVDRPEFVGLVFGSPTSDVDDISDGSLPARSSILLQASPNPFNPTTEIAYELAGPQSVKLNIYDVKGRVVRHLIDARAHSGGRHAVTWNGRSDSGGSLPSGIYFCRLEAGDVVKTIKMALLK